MKTIRILILEDDLKTLAILFDKLSVMEDKSDLYDFAVTILSEYHQVEEYINKKTDKDFDIILLDRDCKAGGSFHILDFSRFSSNKIISISSIPEYNEQARNKGVKRIIWKDYENLDDFSNKVMKEIESLL